mmetsp:Transcript_3188/g.4238  ORF Transcript_3188/g.4238 Transcript_3188/m.4238 type:complete len:204 (-) Transcript_3188:636-1247(-)
MAGTGNINQSTTAALTNLYVPLPNVYQDSSQTSDLSNVSSNNNTEITEVLGAYKTEIAKKKSDFEPQELVQLKYAVYSVVWPKLKFLDKRIMKSMTRTTMYNKMMKTMGKTELSEANQTRYWLSIEDIIETLFKDIRNERNGTLKKKFVTSINQHNKSQFFKLREHEENTSLHQRGEWCFRDLQTKGIVYPVCQGSCRANDWF